MARKGRAGPALGIAAFGSFIAGNVQLDFSDDPCAAALRYGPESGATGVLLIDLPRNDDSRRPGSRICVESALPWFCSVCFSPILAWIWSPEKCVSPMGCLSLPTASDWFQWSWVCSGSQRFCRASRNQRNFYLQGKDSKPLSSLQDWKDSIFPICRGSIIGFLIGILPGPGSTISTFASYGIEKKLSRHPEKFGTGTIEGVAGSGGR